jgi:small-conductance mechanosensitive channel
MIFKKKLFKHFGLILLFTLFFFTPSTAQLEEGKANSQPSAESKPSGPPSEMDQAHSLSEKYQERLSAIQEDLTILQNRIEEGKDELKSEVERVAAFMQIEEIAPEEFTPYLNKWKIMRDSYRDVLETTNNQIDEVNQIRIRLESKIRLWELQEGDLKLLKEKSPKQKQDPELLAQLKSIGQVIQSFEETKEKAEETLTQLGKAKTALTTSLEMCKKNYDLLKTRWRSVRFSYLKIREQPKFSSETFTLALHEFEFRLRDYRTYLDALKNYFEDIWQALSQKFLRTFLFLLTLLIATLGLILIRRSALLKNTPSKEATLLERFGKRLLLNFSSSVWALVPLLGIGILLLVFPEAREPVGIFLLISLGGAYGAWFFDRSAHALFVDPKTGPSLLPVSPKMGRTLYYRISALVVLLYFFILLNAGSSVFEYKSEATRLIKWLLEIFIFGIIFSLARSRWILEIVPKSRQKFVQLIRHLLRFGLFGLLVVIIALDVLGYTNLSDYLADASLKTLGVIPLILFLKKGITELIDYKLFTQGLTKWRVTEELLIKWKKTLRQWTTLGIWFFSLLWISSIWEIRWETFHLIQKILSQGFSVGSVRITLGLLFSVFLTFYGSLLTSRLIRAMLERNIYPRKHWDRGIRNAISTGIHYLIILVGIIIALKFLGFDIRNITVLAGAFGVGLGFGLQNLANNFASGIVLLIERPVKIGDIIQVGTVTGKVKKIGARSTSIETADKATLLVPNGELLAGQVTNWTYGNPVAGLSLPVGVAYGSDIEKVRQLLIQIAGSHPEVLKDPGPQVDFKGFGESSIDFILRVWIQDVEDRRNVQTDLFFAIEKILRENQISIPYPHRVVIKTKEE